jgi:hypothetical protein
MSDFGSIVAQALRWGVRLAVVAFVLAFFVPLLVGGPGAHQGPLGAFIYAPMIFLLALEIALLIQFRRAMSLSTVGKLSYVCLLILLLIPVLNTESMYSGLGLLQSFKSIDTEDYTSDKRLEHVPPLTSDEQRLLEATHFTKRISIVNPNFPPAYTRSLINDIKKTGLFDEVVEFDRLGNDDFIATIKGTYWGDKEGQSFTLHQPANTTNTAHIKVYYTLGGIISKRKERKQYIDRLSIEIIQAIEELSTSSKSGTGG